MRLLRVEAEDWLSYPVLDLDFSDVHQVVITGANGHGKSAILDAIRYCLFGDGRGSPDQMVATGALATGVRTTWQVRDHSVTVSRRRDLQSKAGSTDLRLVVDGVSQTKHTIAETQAAIDKLLRLPTAAIMSTAFMVQGESDSVMRATPASRKELLVALLGLDRYEPFHEQAKSRARSAQADIISTERQLPALEELAAGIETAKAATELGGRELKKLDESIEQAISKAEELKSRISFLKERQERLAGIEHRHTELENAVARETKALTRYERGIEKARQDADVPEPVFDLTPPEQTVTEEEVTLWEESRGHHAALSQKRALIDSKLEAISEANQTRASVPCGGKGEFASCRFLRADTQSELQLRKDRDTLDDLIAVSESMKDPRPAFTVLREANHRYLQGRAIWKERLGHWRTVHDRAAADIPVLERHAGESKAEIGRLSSAITDNQKERLRLSQDQMGYDTLEEEARAVSRTLIRLKDERDSTRLMLDEARLAYKQAEQADGQVARLRTHLKTFRADADKWEVLSKAFHRDGIPTMVLENSLPVIETRANEVLERMPGGFAIEIVTQKQTKTSGMRETLDVTVYVDGMERPYGLLSGGEKFRVDFALRVALASVLATRTGATMRTLWLDEPLASLDRVGRESVLDTLQAVSDDFDLVVVVSHHDEFNDRFPSRVEVQKNGYSTAILT